MSTLSKLRIEVNMGRNIRLEMCHGEDLSKVVLVDVTSGRGVIFRFWGWR